MRKNLTLLVLLILMGSAASAQYYYLPFLSPGQNPGNLNTDAEYPVGSGLLDPAWSIIKGNSATPAWSDVEVLPFAFNFDGNPVTDFKVTTSGILTFDTGTSLAAPSVNNVALPSALIPDKSICVWGIQGTGTNDSIVVKTFGTAPNRQFWIAFNSYSLAGSTTNYAYFSIVLEETTNNIYIVDQRTNTTTTLTLGVQINSTTGFNVAGAPSTPIRAGSSPSPSDNVYYAFYYGTQASSEAELTSVSVSTPFLVPPGTSNVTGKLTNFGVNPITDVTIKYETNGTVYSDVRTGLNVAFGASYSFTHGTPINVASAGGYLAKVWIEVPADANPTNDTLRTMASGLASVPSQKVVFEEATGTWCQWCPRGAVYMDSLASVHPTTALLIAVHNGDPMTNAVYDAGMGGLVSGYPSGLVGRFNNDVDPSTFFNYYATRINDLSPCNVTVGVTYDNTTSLLTVEMSADMVTDVYGDYRFNAVVVEDDVTGTGSTYSQSNAYSGGANGVMGGYELLSNPVPYSQMHYDHVGREILGGFKGEPGSMPVDMYMNNVYTHTFTYTVPSTYDISQIHVIGWVSGPTGKILNANRGDITVGLPHPEATSFSAKVYPNPASSYSTLLLNLKKGSDVTVDIYDMTGKLLRSNTSNLDAGEFNYNLNLNGMPSGVYTIKIAANGENLTKRLVIAE